MRDAMTHARSLDCFALPLSVLPLTETLLLVKRIGRYPTL